MAGADITKLLRRARTLQKAFLGTIPRGCRRNPNSLQLNGRGRGAANPHRTITQKEGKKMTEATPSKSWYLSTTVWVGILTTIAGLVPLVIEIVKVVAAQPADPTVLAAAIGAFVLGVIQVIRRVWLDGETTPAALK